MSQPEPIKEILKLSVLGHSPKEISTRLSELGLTVPERRVKAIQTRIGDDTIRWIREEYMDDVATTIFDYRRELQARQAMIKRRFEEADREYDNWKTLKGQTFAQLLQDYRNDSNPNIATYIAKANAMTEGMNLTKLSTIMKALNAEEAKILELGAKLDAKLNASGGGNVPVQEGISVEEAVAAIFEILCDDCRDHLSELDLSGK